MQVYKIYYFEW